MYEGSMNGDLESFLINLQKQELNKWKRARELILGVKTKKIPRYTSIKNYNGFVYETSVTSFVPVLTNWI